MALKTITSLLCDRCGNVIEEIEDAGAGDRSAQVSYLLLEVQDVDGTVVRFDDVCKKCRGRIEALVGQIKLEKSTNKESKSNGADDAPQPPEEAPEEDATTATA